MTETVNLKDVLANINDPNNGYVKQLGSVTIPWSGEAATGYEILQFTGNHKSILYSDPTTGEVEWIFDTFKNDALKVNGGIQAKTFTDVDFQITDNSACNNAKISAVTQLENLFFF